MSKVATAPRQVIPSSRRNKWIQSRLWMLAFIGCTIACVVIYVVNALFAQIHPGNWWGLGYGIAAAVLLLGAAVYGLRRRTMRLRPGRTWYYLQFHVYGGTLFLLLVFMHIGFKVPQGILTWWLWFLSIWIVVSGLLGVVIQKWIPTLLNSGLTLEVHYDRIPELIETLKEKAEAIVEASDYQVRDFYRQNLQPAFSGPKPRLMYFVDITGGIRGMTDQFDYLARFLAQDEKFKLGELQKIYKSKLEMDAHYTLQRALRWWLYLHLPVSLVLILLLGYHIFAVVYY